MINKDNPVPRRSTLTERQWSALFDLPTDQATILRHYTLANDDIELVRTRLQSYDRLGFDLPLCAIRYPGRLLVADEVIPFEVGQFTAAQLVKNPDDLSGYAETDTTRRRHLADLRSIYGYRMLSHNGARDLKVSLEGEAQTALSNEDLARTFVEECRRTRTALPGISVIELLCAGAPFAAEHRMES